MMMPSLSTCTNQTRASGMKANGNHYQRNRKTHVYVSSNNSTNFNNYAISTTTSAIDEEEAYRNEEPSMTTSPPPVSQTQYKWTQQLTTAIQSAFEILVNLLLTFVSFLWNWTTNYFFVYILENRFVKEVWNYLIATMTIEIVTTSTTTTTADHHNHSLLDKTMDSTTVVSTLTSLPVIRLNSVVWDEEEDDHYCGGVLLEDTEEDRIDHGIESGGSDFVQSSSNYNSSDGEQDTIVFTDDENNYSNKNLASTLEFLEKQQQQYASRRDSDSSCDDSSENKENGSSNDNNNKSEDIEARIISQVESMFSDDHLAKDGFLLKHVKRRTDGYVSLKLVAGLRKVKQISRSFNVVVEALRKAQKVEINAEGSKVRRVEPLTPFLKALPISSGNKDKENKDNSNSQPIQQQQQKRNSYSSSSRKLSPNSLPSNPAQQRPKSNSYCEGANNNSSNPIWLQKRLASSRTSEGNISLNNHSQNRNQLKPNSSSARPKSNSYCEGTNINESPVGMSVWLQKRKTSSKTSEGNISLSATVIRQPRGPDGTKGFMTGYRQVILQERQVRERKMGQQMI